MPASVLDPSPVPLSPGSGLGTIRVAIAHRQRLVRAGLRVLLEGEGGIEVVEASTYEEAIAVARRLPPDVMLMDVDLPGLGCVEVTRQILADPPIAVVVLAATETDAARVFSALVHAVRRLSRGGRARAPRAQPSNLAPEVRVLTPKVTEIRRGCAHAAAAAQPKAGVTPAA